MKNCQDLRLEEKYNFGLYLFISIHLNTGIKLTVDFVIQPHCQFYNQFI